MIVLEDARKGQYGIGSHNADRRKAENAAAASRAAGSNHVRTHTSGTPLAGNRAAHAPTRNARRVQDQGSRGGSGGGGSAATAPVADLPADIDDGKGDDIVARQIREAAMVEFDPALREKLWQEYRRYSEQSR